MSEKRASLYLRQARLCNHFFRNNSFQRFASFFLSFFNIVEHSLQSFIKQKTLLIFPEPINLSLFILYDKPLINFMVQSGIFVKVLDFPSLLNK